MNTKHIVELAVTTESDKPISKKYIRDFVEAAMLDRMENKDGLAVNSCRVRKVDLD